VASVLVLSIRVILDRRALVWPLETDSAEVSILRRHRTIPMNIHGMKQTTHAVYTALLVAALAAAGACGAGPSQPPPDDRPALNDKKIRESLFHAWVDDVPEETGAAEPITWYFRSDEPTEITVVERQMDGDNATLLVDVATRTSPGAKHPKSLSGRLRLHYALETVLFLRKWRVVDVENLSMKYRDESPPEAEPSADGPQPPVEREAEAPSP
jgi:hypothetical protein